MSILAYIYRNGLWISVPLSILSAALLVYFILNVIRVVKQAHLRSVPLLEQQEIEFSEEGRVVLCTQGPLLSLRFANLDYELTEDGVPIKGRTTWFHSKTSGFSWVRMEVKSYRIPGRGATSCGSRDLSQCPQPWNKKCRCKARPAYFQGWLD